MASGSKVQQTGRTGEYYVAAELNRRGAYAVTFAGNMPKIDVLASDEEPPIFYIVPDWWIRNDIHEKCVAYIKKHKGKQSSSTHHGIDVKRIERWKDRWDILRIF